MKKNLHITTNFDKPDFLREMVEKLATKFSYGTKNKVAIMPGWEEMETSTAEAFATGDINFEDDGVKLPFTTSYLFTCAVKGNVYHLKWAISLS